MNSPVTHPAPSTAPANRRAWWIGAGVVGGVGIVGATALFLAARHSPPRAQGSASTGSPAATVSPSPSELPEFEVQAVTVLEGRATWYKVPANSLPQRRAWPGEFTAASDRIAPDSYVRVHRLDAGSDPEKSIVVRITDDGVQHRDTVLDLNRPAAYALGMVKDGEAHVRAEVLALKNVSTDKPVGKKSDPPLLPKASEITDQPTATRRQERENAREKVADQPTP